MISRPAIWTLLSTFLLTCSIAVSAAEEPTLKITHSEMEQIEINKVLNLHIIFGSSEAQGCQLVPDQLTVKIPSQGRPGVLSLVARRSSPCIPIEGQWQGEVLFPIGDQLPSLVPGEYSLFLNNHLITIIRVGTVVQES